MIPRHFTFPTVLLFFVITTAAVFANTWYVDPVNGSLDYTGKSPFKNPYSNEGPAKEIAQVTEQAGEYDIVVLMDGVYTGSQNTAIDIFMVIDFKHLYVISAYGPENCRMVLDGNILFNNPVFYEEIPTTFSGITFTSELPLEDVAIRIDGSNVLFEKCIFTEFKTGYPEMHIIRADWSYVRFENCTFKSNHTLNIIGCGTSTLNLDNSVFTENEMKGSCIAEMVGAGNSDLHVKGCSFTKNTSDAPFTVIGCGYSNLLWVEDCVIKDNPAKSLMDSHGIYINEVNCIVLSNTEVSNLGGQPMGSTGVYAYLPGTFNMYDCQVNYNSLGLGITAGTASYVQVSNCDFIGNRSFGPTPGGIRLNVQDCGSEIDIRDCAIQNNSAGIWASSLDASGTINISNCLITDNEFDGIVSGLNGQVAQQVTNCTIVNNNQGGAFKNTTLKNCILRQFKRDVITVNEINYCNVEGGWTGPGVGNIDVDPLFVDGGEWSTDPSLRVPGTDYHLKSTAGRFDDENGMLVQDDADSPCIDAGDPDDVPYFEPYGSGGRVDMGAYGNTHEASLSYRCGGGYRGSGMMFSDINKDCHVNLADFAIMAGEWLDSTESSI